MGIFVVIAFLELIVEQVVVGAKIEIVVSVLWGSVWVSLGEVVVGFELVINNNWDEVIINSWPDCVVSLILIKLRMVVWCLVSASVVKVGMILSVTSVVILKVEIIVLVGVAFWVDVLVDVGNWSLVFSWWDVLNLNILDGWDG